MTTYYAKRGDVGSFVTESLLDGNGAGVVLTGASVRFLMRARDAVVPKVAADAEIVDAGNGVVRYVWTEGDLDAAGYFRAEWEVTYAAGAIETFPADGYVAVLVREDLDVSP